MLQCYSSSEAARGVIKNLKGKRHFSDIFLHVRSYNVVIFFRRVSQSVTHSLASPQRISAALPTVRLQVRPHHSTDRPAAPIYYDVVTTLTKKASTQL
jgi:hypothetical protein